MYFINSKLKYQIHTHQCIIHNMGMRLWKNATLDNRQISILQNHYINNIYIYI